MITKYSLKIKNYSKPYLLCLATIKSNQKTILARFFAMVDFWQLNFIHVMLRSRSREGESEICKGQSRKIFKTRVGHAVGHFTWTNPLTPIMISMNCSYYFWIFWCMNQFST